MAENPIDRTGVIHLVGKNDSMGRMGPTDRIDALDKLKLFIA